MEKPLKGENGIKTARKKAKENLRTWVGGIHSIATSGYGAWHRFGCGTHGRTQEQQMASLSEGGKGSAHDHKGRSGQARLKRRQKERGGGCAAGSRAGSADTICVCRLCMGSSGGTSLSLGFLRFEERWHTLA